MNKKKKIMLLVTATVTGLGWLVNEIKKKNKIEKLEDEIRELKYSSEALMVYQHEKNKRMEDRLDELVDEFASVYTHMEELAEIK
ncbi:hypothetical protein [Facklamia sp. P12955]|uniref:hypothetical protein n=1 Tax=Facklamia sp. P12955 TaxID=3421946 RepID=UPI003D16E983